MQFRFCRRLVSACFALIFVLSTARAAGKAKLPAAIRRCRSFMLTTETNSAAAQKAHYVVLVSLDGFRWDYAKRDGATHLLALGKQGVWAPQGMMPSYPSLTFPNHFTIVTGLYPEHHGLVANNFYDETKQALAMRSPIRRQ